MGGDAQQPHDTFWKRWLDRLTVWIGAHPVAVRVIQLAGLLLIVALSFVLVLVPEVRESFEAASYVGAFLVNLISSATVILPAPGTAITCVLVMDTNVWLLALVAAVGSSLGEVVAYMIGYTSKEFVAKSRYYGPTKRWFDRFSGPVVLVLAFLPLVADFGGLLAGAARMNVYRFLAWLFVGKLLKFLLLLWVCQLGIDWLVNFL